MTRENYRYLTDEQLRDALAEYKRILQLDDLNNGLRKEYDAALCLARDESERRKKAAA